jgi:hypothetical protein
MVSAMELIRRTFEQVTPALTEAEWQQLLPAVAHALARRGYFLRYVFRHGGVIITVTLSMD